METREIMILGTPWTIKFHSRDMDDNLENADGYTDSSAKLIVIDAMESREPGMKLDLDAYRAQVLRHEIIHAFLFESGLEHNTHKTKGWAVDEEIVDWFSIQGPKILEAFKDAECI